MKTEVYRILIASITLLLSACSSTVPAMQYYLLASAPGRSLVEDDRVNIYTETVELPPYINHLGMVLVDEERQVHIARNNLWAEPLQMGITRQLRNQLHDETRPADAGLHIRIHYLHGAPSGEVMLDVGWELESSGCRNASVSGRFTDELVQAEAGYMSLAAAHAELLTRLADTVYMQAQQLDTTGCET